MDTSKDIGRQKGFLKRFKHWSATIVLDLNHPGSVVIRAVRTGVKRASDLTPEERTELYGTIIPRLERMIESVLDRGPLTIMQQWVANAFYLMPEGTGGRTSSELYSEYFRAINAATA